MRIVAGCMRRGEGRPTSAGLAVAAALLLTACSGAADSGAADSGRDRVIYGGGEGPLWVSSGSGSLSITSPQGRDRWSGSFGAFTLCASESDRELVLERVRVETAERAPSEVQVFLRTVPPADGGASATRSAGSPEMFLSTRGRPPDFDQPYSEGIHSGDYTTDLSGTSVTQPCDPRPNPTIGYQELIFALTVGPEGGEVRRAWVDYTADGDPRSVEMTWRMIACGSAFGAGACPR